MILKHSSCLAAGVGLWKITFHNGSQEFADYRAIVQAVARFCWGSSGFLQALPLPNQNQQPLHNTTSFSLSSWQKLSASMSSTKSLAPNRAYVLRMRALCLTLVGYQKNHFLLQLCFSAIPEIWPDLKTYLETPGKSNSRKINPIVKIQI